MKDVSREKVIHSSLHEVIRYGSDSDFPLPAPSIGVLVKRKHFGGAEIVTHLPRISSLIEGEIVECENSQLDISVRQQLLSLAEHCEELANWLMNEKKRLEKEAEMDILIHDTTGATDSQIDPFSSKDRARDETSIPSTPSPRSRSSINLDAFK